MPSGSEADRLFKQAYEKFASTLAIDPQDPEALYVWGKVLSAQVEIKSGAEADELFRQAYEKHDAAVAINRDLPLAFHYWGLSLMAQAKALGTAEKGQRKMLLNLAKEEMLKSESIAPGDGTYDLACISTLLGKEQECLDWLTKGRDLGTLPDREYLEKDSDLDSIRTTKWFLQFKESLNR